jgi:hypothetical protein
MQAIQIKVLPATNTRGTRLKAWCLGGSLTVGRDYEYGPTKQARMLAHDLIHHLGWNVQPCQMGTLPNGDWVVTVRGPESDEIGRNYDDE